MKKILTIILCFVLILSLTGCKKEDNNSKSDALKFKKEYEKLNGNDAYVKVILSENNYFKYVTNKGLVKILNEKSGMVFIGSANSNESRNIVNVLSYVNSPIIYYIDINNLSDYSKKVLNEKASVDLSKPVVIGVLNGEVIKSQVGTGYESFELTAEEKNNLKLIYDDINAKVSDDACDIEQDTGC